MTKKRSNIFRKNRPLFLIIVAILIYVSWIFIDQQLRLRELVAEEESLRNQIEELKLVEQRLIEEKNLINDPKYIEKVARERLKMVMPNEIIYIDQDKAKFAE